MPRKRKLLEMFKAQNGHCAWCGCDMSLNPNQPTGATREHIQPRSLGGKNGYFNEVAACRSCNQDKADKKLIDEWIPPAFFRWVL